MVDLLNKSIARYRAVLEHAEQLEALLSKGDPQQLKAYTIRLGELQHEAGLNDHELHAEVAQDFVNWQAHPLFQQRMQLLEQIVEMNDLLLPRIRGMMSVTAAELGQLRGGKAAVAGYHRLPAREKKPVRGVG